MFENININVMLINEYNCFIFLWEYFYKKMFCILKLNLIYINLYDLLGEGKYFFCVNMYMNMNKCVVFCFFLYLENLKIELMN